MEHLDVRETLQEVEFAHDKVKREFGELLDRFQEYVQVSEEQSMQKSYEMDEEVNRLRKQLDETTNNYERFIQEKHGETREEPSN